MKRLIHTALLLALTVLISTCTACSKNAAPSPTPNTASAEDISKKLSTLVEKGGSKEELLAGLRDKGDLASKIEKTVEPNWSLSRGVEQIFQSQKRARWAYTLANLFNPENENVAAKLKSLGGQVTNEEVDSDARAQLVIAITSVSVDDKDNINIISGKPPKLTPEMELVNLRMLLDERLVGDLGYTRIWISLDGSQFSISFEEPKTKPGAIRSELWGFLNEPTISMDEVRATYGKPSIAYKDMHGVKVTNYGLLRFFSDKSEKIQGIFLPIVDGGIPKIARHHET